MLHEIDASQSYYSFKTFYQRQICRHLLLTFITSIEEKDPNNINALFVYTKANDRARVNNKIRPQSGMASGSNCVKRLCIQKASQRQVRVARSQRPRPEHALRHATARTRALSSTDAALRASASACRPSSGLPCAPFTLYSCHSHPYILVYTTHALSPKR
jgi:hypothetical protein